MSSSTRGPSSTSAEPPSVREGTAADPAPESVRFPPEQEAALRDESHSQKEHANQLFRAARYPEAIQQYAQALSTCPNYLAYEVAVLKSNLAACHLKLGEWQSAIEAATAAVDGLGGVERDKGKADGEEVAVGKKGAEKGESAAEEEEEEEEAEDVISPGALRIGPLATADEEGQTSESRQRIRIKALTRRAKARTELGGWSALSGAEEAQKEAEMGEMMSKLKELGNGILKPFGLSTENFKMTKDENSGGYNMQFQQGGS
ncbi:MAG: hypothetical protein M1826_002220 [Phylliscum demangeonii]|nr:MAG: hypothetical protein M1826_002220 [Phylliscum demangeonii]